MASSVNSLLGSSAGTTPAAASSSAGLGSAAPSEGVFLQLLVSQLQNQDPLNPTDSTTFVTQLAQFSELEQVIAIRGDTDTLAADASTTSGQGTTGATSGSQPATPTSDTTTTNLPTTNSSTAN